MNTTLGVFLRDYRGLKEVSYGTLLSINAIIVVVMQFWVTRKLEKFKPMLMMAIGTLLYAVGFAMYGFVTGFILFITAMVIITIGEMVVSPFQQSIVARTLHGSFRVDLEYRIHNRTLLCRATSRQ
jgi:MFS family permease